jgi:hypothetical protein
MLPRFSSPYIVIITNHLDSTPTPGARAEASKYSPYIVIITNHLDSTPTPGARAKASKNGHQ